MVKRIMKNQLGILAAFAGLTILVNSASAGVFTFGPNGEFSGTNALMSGSVLVRIENDGANTVKVTVDATGLDPLATEKITGLYLNIDESITSGLTFSTSPDPMNETINYQDTHLSYLRSAGFQPDGDGKFNIQIDWNEDVNVGVLTGGGISVFSISAPGLDEADFFGELSYQSNPNKTGYEAVLRVMSMPPGDQSGWYAPTSSQGPEVLPEPASLAIWGLGIVGCAALRIRRRKIA
jgi:hypothetical protein